MVQSASVHLNQQLYSYIIDRNIFVFSFAKWIIVFIRVLDFSILFLNDFSEDFLDLHYLYLFQIYKSASAVCLLRNLPTTSQSMWVQAQLMLLFSRVFQRPANDHEIPVGVLHLLPSDDWNISKTTMTQNK